jgi:hypothetical protein
MVIGGARPHTPKQNLTSTGAYDDRDDVRRLKRPMRVG